MADFDYKKLLEFLELVGQLKHIKRTGWLLKNIDDCETIAGHMYRMGMMTFLIKEDSGLDRLRCLEIALVHDLAECIVGDITPFCGVSEVDKHRMEDEAMQKISKLIGFSGENVYRLYKEYENKSSPEAEFVKQLDKFDFVLQAFEYEKREKTTYQDIFDNMESKITHPMLTKLLSEIQEQRKNFVHDK
ncbi:5'-deoxynucleotidase HDDC2 [Arctopsyche grandis]|uniref:5'-deoxynucleotidase HDDC2 n=1 Tax=Arctopsyche grandis TaxID=121162 RepID=UPI00406D6B42